MPPSADQPNRVDPETELMCVLLALMGAAFITNMIRQLFAG